MSFKALGLSSSLLEILEKKDFGQIFITDTHIDRVKDALSESKNKEEIFKIQNLTRPNR